MTAPLIRRASLLSLALLGGTLPTAARADAMKPWSGASATIESGKYGESTPVDASNGPTATASYDWSGSVKYKNEMTHGDFETVGNLYGTADAGPAAGKLLSVTSGGTVGNGGSYAYPYAGQVISSASWKEDAIQLTAPSGGSFPDTIRLNFRFEFIPDRENAGYDTHYVGMTLAANDKTIEIKKSTSPQYGQGNFGPGYKASDFDSLKDGSVLMASGRLFDTKVGTFHIDLPVHADGVSGPFSLSIKTVSHVWAEKNSNGLSNLLGTLSLDSVTLPDGTLLADKGYGVAFASGMTGLTSQVSPQPVPEPASVAMWALAAAVGVGLARKRGVLSAG